MDGALPGLPNFAIGVVDVRDVADLHLRAMTSPAAAGERFLAASGDPMTVADMAAVLRAHFGEAARRVPTRRLPDWVLRVVGRFDSAVAVIARAGQGQAGQQREGANRPGLDPALP